MASNNNIYVWAAVAVFAFALLVNNGAAAATITPGADFLSNFPGLANSYVVSGDSDSLLNSILSEMVIRGYSVQQIEFMLSQILFETGLLVPGVANTNLINQNNFAGLTSTSGGYAAYSSISDFMDAYNVFLTKGSNPLGATSLTDFNNRLIANKYYTESPAVYLNGLQTYYNALNS
jgi:hypothetical protein